jgi:nitric oxide reductase subunit B
MVTLSILPIGIIQTWASAEKGYWFARSSELLYSPVMQTLKWLRVPGDIIFALGILSLVLYIFKITFEKKDNSLSKITEKEKETKLV